MSYCDQKYGGHKWGPWYDVTQGNETFERRDCERCTEYQIRKKRK